MAMDENPYQAPRTSGRPPRKTRFWREFFDLLLLIVVGAAIVFVLFILFALPKVH